MMVVMPDRERHLNIIMLRDAKPNLASSAIAPCHPHPTMTSTTTKALSQRREESSAHVTSAGERKVKSISYLSTFADVIFSPM